MKTLHELQKKFLELYSSESADASWIRGDSQEEKLTRFAVYRNACKQRFFNVLTEDFAVLRQVMGKEKFDPLAIAFERAFPLESDSLNDFGAKFSEHLVSEGVDELYVELARFEWLFAEVFFEARDSALDLEKLQKELSRSKGNPKLRLTASTRLLESIYPVGEIFESKKAKPAEQSQYLFYRGSEKSHYEKLQPWEHRLLEGLDSGLSLAQAIEESMQTESIEEKDIQESFTRWISLKVLRS